MAVTILNKVKIELLMDGQPERDKFQGRLISGPLEKQSKLNL